MNEILQYIVEHWGAITAVLVGVASVLVSPVVWYRTMKEKTAGAEIAAIAENNKVMREEFAEMNKEMSEHRSRIRTLELLVLDKELNEKRLVDQLHEKDKQLGQKDKQLAKADTQETKLHKEISRLTGLLERCQKCAPDE